MVLADTIVENVLQPLLTPVITLVLFFLFYALLRLLVSMLVTVLGLVNKLPVIGTVNRALGWIGAAARRCWTSIWCCACCGASSRHRRQPECAQRHGDGTSLYYKVFNLFNPFL